MPLPANAAENAFDALGNHVRRQILRILSREPSAVGEIAAALPVSRPAVSRHLRILEKAQLVSHARRGSSNIFQVNEQAFRSAQADLEEFWSGTLARFKLVAENRPSRRKPR